MPGDYDLIPAPNFREHGRSFWQVKSLENWATGAGIGLKFHQNLIDADDICVLEEFSREEDCNRILALGSWSFDNKPLVLKPWSPDENYELESLAAIPVWVRFPGLNLHLRSEEILNMLASTVGKPIRTDGYTASTEKLSYAKVLIEIYVANEIKKEVCIKGPRGTNFIQRIEYDWIPPICVHCQRFGHFANKCLIPRLAVECDEEKEDRIIIEPGGAGVMENILSIVKESGMGAEEHSPNLGREGSSSCGIGDQDSIEMSRDFGDPEGQFIEDQRGKNRLLLLWNPDVFAVNIWVACDQAIICEVEWKGKKFMAGFVYAFNSRIEQNALWDCMTDAMSRVDGAWLWSGDFNCLRYPTEKLNEAKKTLQTLKGDLKIALKDYKGDMSVRVEQSWQALLEAQRLLFLNPEDGNLRAVEEAEL
ncbi:hypothetical protein QQ045_003216 [Rhodiola kirilowii]